jgi:hypothetical protein
MQQIEIEKVKLDKFYERLAKGAIVKALRGWKKSNIPFKQIEEDLLNSIDNAYKKKNVGIILSAYYEIGQFASYNITELLNILFEKKDYPTFLKQAYRFGVYEGFEEKINATISWHEGKKLPDAFAWKLKFEKLKENQKFEKLALKPIDSVDTRTLSTIKVLDEEQSEKKKDFVYLELKAIKRKDNIRIEKSIEEVEQQPYIMSQVSKKKLENANHKHSITLKILKNELTKLGYETTETKHIDAFAIIKNVPAIFEVKSINEDNENDQVRAAISQLYEYRFLYSLTNATLWIVFSEPPYSDWIIEYLSKDREINILWIEENKLTGISKGFLN